MGIERTTSGLSQPAQLHSPPTAAPRTSTASRILDTLDLFKVERPAQVTRADVRAWQRSALISVGIACVAAAGVIALSSLTALGMGSPGLVTIPSTVFLGIVCMSALGYAWHCYTEAKQARQQLQHQWPRDDFPARRTLEMRPFPQDPGTPIRRTQSEASPLRSPSLQQLDDQRRVVETLATMPQPAALTPPAAPTE